MEKTQPKTAMFLTVRVNKKDGKKLGGFEITSGNVSYYRANARNATKKYTWRMLSELIERDLKGEV